jgi:hypothetical protein
MRLVSFVTKTPGSCAITFGDRAKPWRLKSRATGEITFGDKSAERRRLKPRLHKITFGDKPAFADSCR